MIKIYSYNRYSKSARALADAMDVWMLKHQRSRWRPTARDAVINWGRGRMFDPAWTLNEPQDVENVVNKLRFFQMITEYNEEFPETPVRIPAFTTDIAVARAWCGVDCTGRARKVVVRRLLNAHEGRGIEIHSMPDDIPQAPLYVKYIPKSAEYRVHIVSREIIDVQQKVLRRTVDPTTANWGVRNTANGFVFQRQNINIPEDVKIQAIRAITASGLDFAAADVVWHHRRDKAYILELNSAPGIEGTTVQNYANALRRYIDS